MPSDPSERSSLTIRGLAEARAADPNVTSSTAAATATVAGPAMDVAASQTSSGQPSTSALPPLPVQPGQEGEEQATNGSTLEDAGTTSSSTLNAEEKGKQKEQESTPLEPERPWPLVEFGIPRPPRHIAPDANVEAKLAHFHHLRKTQNLSFNASLTSNKSFRNPAILSKLVDFVNVDEKLSLFPNQIWSSSYGMGKDAWSDRLTELQKERSERRQREQERGKRDRIGFEKATTATATTTGIGSDAGKEREGKRSRWDAGTASHSSSSAKKDRERDYREKDRDRDRDRRDRYHSSSSARDRSRSPSRRR